MNKSDFDSNPLMIPAPRKEIKVHYRMMVRIHYPAPPVAPPPADPKEAPVPSDVPENDDEPDAGSFAMELAMDAGV